MCYLAQAVVLLTYLHMGGARYEFPRKTTRQNFFLNSLSVYAHIICVTLKCIALAKIWGKWTV